MRTCNYLFILVMSIILECCPPRPYNPCEELTEWGPEIPRPGGISASAGKIYVSYTDTVYPYYSKIVILNDSGQLIREWRYHHSPSLLIYIDENKNVYANNYNEILKFDSLGELKACYSGYYYNGKWENFRYVNAVAVDTFIYVADASRIIKLDKNWKCLDRWTTKDSVSYTHLTLPTKA